MEKNFSEIIFEIRWGNQNPFIKGKVLNTPDYNIILGRFLELFKKNYTSLEPLPTSGMPESIARGIIQYRLRKSDSEKFPLVQLGPGVFTINNNTDNFDEFKKLIFQAAEIFAEVTNGIVLDELKMNLTYVFAYKFDSEKESLNKFIKDNFKIEVIIGNNNMLEEMSSFTFHTKIPTDNPSGFFIYTLTEGKKIDQKAFILQCKLESKINKVGDKKELISWIDSANKYIRKWV